MTQETFGRMPDGSPVYLFTIGGPGTQARISTYGGIVVSCRVPDRNGNSDDVVLGFDTLDEYVRIFNSKENPYFGAIIGRYANRIARGKFTLDGKTYSVPVNDGPNSLHGGAHGFHNVVWTGKEIPDGVELHYSSKDGEEGYPGNLSATVRYTLHESALSIDFEATADKPTVVNLTNHSYFNLAGQGRGNILDHEVTICASRFTPTDSSLIPTGELRSVAGTPFDFRQRHRVGDRIGEKDEQLRFAGGYDQNWVLDSSSGELSKAAEVFEPNSGRVLELFTTQPGVQFYTGNFLTGKLCGKDGAVYAHRGGFCLETQHFPDSPNHAQFPSVRLAPGERYRERTVFRFSVRASR